jgi:hypothetical protein
MVFWKHILDIIFNKQMSTTILVQILYLKWRVLQLMLQSCMYVSMYVHTVKSYQYNSQITEMHRHESYSPSALCRFRLPTQLTKTSQLQLIHIAAAAIANALACYMPTFMAILSKAYPHASKPCLGKLGKCNTWIPGLLWNTFKGFPERMVKPSIDFIQLRLN